MTTLKSNQELVSFVTSAICYENIIITDSAGNIYYMKPEDIVTLVKKYPHFEVEKKRIRTWLKPKK